MIEFDINNHVFVKLTNAGRQKLRQNHDDLGALPKYQPPNEDSEGWSKWQMWQLMSDLGSDCNPGADNPFETTIRIDFGH